MPCLRVVIRGRVQGVGFRYFALSQARSLSLKGWVRNRPDGSVELEAEGEQGDLERLIERLRRDPTGARVDAVDEAWSAKLKQFKSFDIMD